MTTTTKVVLGILGAAAAGVVIGLLVAPEKGSDTRKKLKQTAGDWADSLTHLWSQGKKAAEETMDEAGSRARQAKSTAEDKVNKLKESFS